VKSGGCGGSSVNGICFNKIKFLKLLPSCKSVNPLQRSYLKLNKPVIVRHKRSVVFSLVTGLFCFVLSNLYYIEKCESLVLNSTKNMSN